MGLLDWLLVAAGSAVVGGLAGMATSALLDWITEDVVEEKIGELEIDDAFKYKLHKAKQTNTYNVGIFDQYTNELDNITLESENGLDGLKCNQWYYLN